MKRIIVDGAVFSTTGYGNIVRGLSLALLKKGIDLRIISRDWANLGDVDGLSDEDKNLLKSSVVFDGRDLFSDSIFLSINIASIFSRKSKLFNVGFTMLETDKISPYWADRCNQMDLILVPTSFNIETFRNSGVVVPIEEVPLSVDQSLFTPDKNPLEIKGFDTKFNFLINAQFSSGDRKGVYYLLRAFLETFKDNPEVGLILKVFISTDSILDNLICESRIKEVKERMNIGEFPRVCLCNGNFSLENLSRLYHNGQVFILPTLGESWAIPIHEAIMSGIPVITTGGSAAERYLDGNLVRFLKYHKVQIPDDLYCPKIYERDMQVTLPDLRDLKESMSDAYKNYKFYKVKADLQREKIKYLTWDYSADKLIKSIEKYL